MIASSVNNEFRRGRESKPSADGKKRGLLRHQFHQTVSCLVDEVNCPVKAPPVATGSTKVLDDRSSGSKQTVPSPFTSHQWADSDVVEWSEKEPHLSSIEDLPYLSKKDEKQ